MTRINLVHPSLLADQHLFAEYREIRHVPAALKRRLVNHSINDTLKVIPLEFTLNRGHVTFFYDKLKYLEHRFYELKTELWHRNYNIDASTMFDTESIPPVFMGIWKADKIAVNTIKERIITRLSEKPAFYRYYGETKTPQFFKELMQ